MSNPPCMVISSTSNYIYSLNTALDNTTPSDGYSASQLQGGEEHSLLASLFFSSLKPTQGDSKGRIQQQINQYRIPNKGLYCQVLVLSKFWCYEQNFVSVLYLRSFVVIYLIHSFAEQISISFPCAWAYSSVLSFPHLPIRRHKRARRSLRLQHKHASQKEKMNEPRLK